MPIRTAAEIDFTVLPRCPEPGCGVGVLPYGLREPLVVDDLGSLFCRDHAALHEPEYAARLAAYREERQRERTAASARLAEVDETAAEE